jgi:uncharacterized repeat protein (TIGR01451 family)
MGNLFNFVRPILNKFTFRLLSSFKKWFSMKNFFTKRNLFALLCWALALPFAWSQVQTPLDIALRYVEKNHESWGLTDKDVADIAVNYQYTSKHNGVTHIYFWQRHNGVEVYNALMNFNILPNGQVLHAGKRFISGLAQKVNTTQPSLTPYDAVLKAAAQLGYSGYQDVRLLEKTGENAYRYAGGTLSRSDINVALRYQPVQNGQVRLAWDLAIESLRNSDYWSVRIDAITGEMIGKTNWTVYCQFEKDAYHNHDRACREEQAFKPVQEVLATQKTGFFNDNAVYNVFALPLESPAHGNRSLVTNPADPTASPFGWHDVDGDLDPDFTFTRGNNVHAFKDGNADGSPDGDVSGGAILNFDFPYNENWEPEQMEEASVTNLFYMNNMMHDIAYHYGFDEVSGNFQENNYGNGGASADAVRALGQYGGDDPEGNAAVNNANFSTPPDGSNGTMRMYFWNTNPANVLEVTAPGPVLGFYEGGLAQFGPSIATSPVSGEVVEINDGIADLFSVTDGCEEPFVNSAEVAGKIALIDRGGCFFEQKVVNAEAAGAIAVIICNFEDDPAGMAGVAEIDDPSIPSIMVSSVTCNQIRPFLGLGLQVTLATPSNSVEFLSGDFDNGVIAHEFAHGISNRLTGGPFQAGCLGVGESQGMGEGWSDFFTLVTTVGDGDTGPDRRGIGTYVIRQSNNGTGLRQYPYSTDMNTNPLTYNSIIGCEGPPHCIGTSWNSMLWELYWAFVDEYGWDPDLVNGTGGNNMAIQLVMDGFKMQPCEPGFVDARDAILAADLALFGGANQCLIWEAFAKRGLGYFADQGDPLDPNDGIENFDVLPTCIQELKITKTCTDFIQPGDEIEYTIHIVNHKPETATNVVVSDELPAGVTYVAGSANIAPDVNGNLLSFNLGDMPFGAEITITFKGATDPGMHSIRYYMEDAEESIFGKWVAYPTGAVEGENVWTVTDLFYNSPFQSFFVENIATESQQVFQGIVPQLVQGDQSVLRFYHWYNTQPGADGGLVEISTDEATSWINLKDKIFRNPYTGPIAYTTFTIPFLEAFSGNSGGFIPSYVDLSEYAGQEVLLRFKFGTDEEGDGLGWYVDDIELMDMINYQSEACVSSDEGDFACDTPPSRGTIVDSKLPNSVQETLAEGLNFAAFPNPTQDLLNIQLTSTSFSDVTIRLLTVDGKEMINIQGAFSGAETLPLHVGHLPKGMYMVQVINEGQSGVRKVVIE